MNQLMAGIASPAQPVQPTPGPTMPQGFPDLDDEGFDRYSAVAHRVVEVLADIANDPKLDANMLVAAGRQLVKERTITPQMFSAEVMNMPTDKTKLRDYVVSLVQGLLAPHAARGGGGAPQTPPGSPQDRHWDSTAAGNPFATMGGQ